MTQVEKKEQLKLATANLKLMMKSGDFIKGGEGTKFWIPNMDNPMILPAIVKQSKKTNPTVYLVTPEIKGVEGHMTIMLGDFFNEVQDMDEESYDTEILVKVYTRELNPELTLETINATSDSRREAAEAAGEIYVDRFQTVRKALANKAKGGACKSLLLAGILE